MGRQLAVRLFREFARDDADSVLSIESLTSEILAASARFNAIAGYALNRTGSRTPANCWIPLSRIYDASEHRARGRRSSGVLRGPFRRYQRCSVGECVRRRQLEFARGQFAGSAVPLVEMALAGRIHRQRSPDAHLQAIHGTDAGKYRTFLRFRTAYLPAATLRLR